MAEPTFDLFGSLGLEFLEDKLLTETDYLTQQTETTETGGVAAITIFIYYYITFQGPSVWNSIDEDITSSFLSLFKKKMKHLIKDY